MAKKFFTKASPKAAAGIRRLYQGKGYEIHSKVENDGSMTVVVLDGSDRTGREDQRGSANSMIAA